MIKILESIISILEKLEWKDQVGYDGLYVSCRYCLIAYNKDRLEKEGILPKHKQGCPLEDLIFYILNQISLV